MSSAKIKLAWMALPRSNTVHNEIKVSLLFDGGCSE